MGQMGRAKLADGSNGTTPEIMQAVQAAQWDNTAFAPVISGGDVVGQSDMSYAYTAGVGIRPTPFGAIYVTWSAGTTRLVDKPSSDRYDVIYATEDGVYVAMGEAPPADAVKLGRFRLPAGSTSTSAAVSDYDRDWALPYGSQLGWMGTAYEGWTYGTYAIKEEITWGRVSFYCPTDRDVSIKLLQALYAEHNVSQPDTWNRFGVMRYKLYVDNVFDRTIEMPYDRRYDIQERNLRLFGLSKGRHTIHFLRKHQWGAPPIHFGKGLDGYQVGFVGVKDEGLHQ